MKCPVDKNAMLVVEHRRIELDYCPKCSGVWLDSGELELLIAMLVSEGARAPEIEPDRKEPTGKRRCPICRLKMERVWIGPGQKVLIDRCPAEHGLWFDAGELQRVLCDIAPEGALRSQDMLFFLGEAFRATHGKCT